MKHVGSKYEWERERNADLFRAYRQAIQQASHVNLADICRQVSKMPSKHFWISPRRATIIVRQIENGIAPNLRDNGKRRIQEIFRRYLIARENNPTESTYNLVHDIVFSPAPEFYLTPDSIKVIIHRIKKKRFNQCKKRLQHSL